MRCDFCDLPGPTRSFEAADVVIDLDQPVVHHSVGAWAACDACAELVEADDRDGLVQRTFDRFCQQHPDAATPDVLDIIRTVHVGFWSARG